MLAPPSLEPLDGEEIKPSPANAMGSRASQPPALIHPPMVVFRAESNEDLGQIPAKKEVKGMLKRTKDRSSTPRPILKGDGRKRFSFSPSPELKQSFKKAAHNDPMEERGREPRHKRNLLADLSEVAGTVNIPLPASSILAYEGLPIDRAQQEQSEGCPPVNECREMVAIGSALSNIEGGSPDSGQVDGGVGEDDRDKGLALHHSRSKVNGSTRPNEALGEVLVNLPEMELETNLLSKSYLEPCQSEGLQDVLAVVITTQPKKRQLADSSILELGRDDGYHGFSTPSRRSSTGGWPTGRRAPR